MQWNLPVLRNDKAEEDERKERRIQYAAICRFYHVNPSSLTYPERMTLLEGFKWNLNLEKGEHPEGSWLERNSVPGSIVILS